MRFLFVHQNFPGQFIHILRRLVQAGGHEIVFISEPNGNEMPGVRKVPYTRPPLDCAETHISARELDNGVRRAEAVFKVAYNLNHLGFVPDIIIGHHGWGEMLNLCDIWPATPMLGYFEFYYQHDKADVGFDTEFPAHSFDFGRIRAKNAINHLALNLPGHGQCPTEWQLSTYPAWAHDRISLLWEGVDLDICSPDPNAHRRTVKVGDMTIRPSDKLVTYVSRDLEPYRGFHVLMRALPRLLRARPDLKAVVVGGDGVSYGAPPAAGGTWKDVLMKEVGQELDLSRVVFPGRVPYSTYLSALKRADAHVYLTYPFVASWSLREALAMGCPVVGSATPPVEEFITHGENGLLAPFLQPAQLADAVLHLLEDKHLSRKLRANARAYAEQRLGMDDYLNAYAHLIERLTGQNPVARPRKAMARKPRRAVSAGTGQPAPPLAARAG